MSKYGYIFSFITWLARSRNASGSILSDQIDACRIEEGLSFLLTGQIGSWIISCWVKQVLDWALDNFLSGQVCPRNNLQLGPIGFSVGLDWMTSESFDKKKKIPTVDWNYLEVKLWGYFFESFRKLKVEEICDEKIEIWNRSERRKTVQGS